MSQSRRFTVCPISTQARGTTYPAQDMCCIFRQRHGLGAFFRIWVRISQLAWRLGKLQIPEDCCTFLKIVEGDWIRGADEADWVCSRKIMSASGRRGARRAGRIEACRFGRKPIGASGPKRCEGASERASSRLRLRYRSAQCGTSRSNNSVSIDSTNPISSPRDIPRLATRSSAGAPPPRA
jgi:hypothetical protein